MKVSLFLCSFLLLLPFASAASLTVFDDMYQVGETVQATVEGQSVSSGSISLVDGNGTIISISPLFSEYREGFTLLYFNLPTTISTGEYTLSVGSLQDTFTVIQGSPVLRIKPGIIILNSGSTSFSVDVSAPSDGTSMLVQVSDSVLRPRKSSVSVSSSMTKSVYVDYAYSDVSEDMSLLLSYGNQSYTVPVIFPGYVEEENETVVNETVEANVTVSTNETVVVSKEDLPFVFLVSNPAVTVTLNESQSVYGDLKVQNIGNDTLSSLHYRLTGDLGLILSLNQTNISLIAGEIYSQRIWFNRENSSRVGTYEGLLILENENYTNNISLSVTVVAFVNTTENLEGNVLENQSTDEYALVYEGDTLTEESNGNGVYIIGVVLMVMLLALIVLAALKLRQKDDRKFNEYIEETKKKK